MGMGDTRTATMQRLHQDAAMVTSMPHMDSKMTDANCEAHIIAAHEQTRIRCIQMNNLGLDHLLHGRLHKARSAFFAANNLVLHRAKFFLDSDVRVYQSNWVDLHSTMSSVSDCDEETKQMMHSIFLFGLRIGDQVHDSNSSTVSNNNSKNDLSAIHTTRIDWAIAYNLGLVAQLLGIVTTTDTGGMNYRIESFDRYEELAIDMVAWYDGLAPLDAAILMMALHNNQGSICRQLRLGHHVEVHWNRMRSILNASKSLRKLSICDTFMDNLEQLVVEQRPAAAA